MRQVCACAHSLVCDALGKHPRNMHLHLECPTPQEHGLGARAACVLGLLLPRSPSAGIHARCVSAPFCCSACGLVPYWVCERSIFVSPLTVCLVGMEKSNSNDNNDDVSYNIQCKFIMMERSHGGALEIRGGEIVFFSF